MYFLLKRDELVETAVSSTIGGTLNRSPKMKMKME
jgi:hypothetical protein